MARSAAFLPNPRRRPRSLIALTDGTDILVRSLDALGSGQNAGPGLYPGLLRQMAVTFAECLGG